MTDEEWKRSIEAKIDDVANRLASAGKLLAGIAGELAKGADSFEARLFAATHVEGQTSYDPRARMKAIKKIAGVLPKGAIIAHKDVVSRLRTVMTVDQIRLLMSELAQLGEIEFMRKQEGRGRPSLYYKRLR